ncbi:hypothetical protein [Bacteroides sp. Marseille-P3684]|uniref:hypothetical protein n=1 Tax=Bacteroides sp. Marseille-P3684 TaxID=2086579 RepID=UPI000D0B16F0|nr:hypothetical protein [Bacteroides sp. Marseille-P3684]
MFVRKKKNRSGTVSVVIADKSSGKFKELKTIGVSSAPDEIVRLEGKGTSEKGWKVWVKR